MQFAPFCSFGVPCLSNLNNSILHITWSMKHFIPSGGDYVRLGDTLWRAQTPLIYSKCFPEIFIFFCRRLLFSCVRNVTVFPCYCPCFLFFFFSSFAFDSLFTENGRRSPLYAFFLSPRGRQCMPFQPSKNDSGALSQLRSYHTTLPCFSASTIVRSIAVSACICPCVCGGSR